MDRIRVRLAGSSRGFTARGCHHGRSGRVITTPLDDLRRRRQPQINPRGPSGIHRVGNLTRNLVTIDIQQPPLLSTMASKLDAGDPPALLRLRAANAALRRSSSSRIARRRSSAASLVSSVIDISCPAAAAAPAPDHDLGSASGCDCGWISSPRWCSVCASLRRELSTHCRNWGDS